MFTYNGGPWDCIFSELQIYNHFKKAWKGVIDFLPFVEINSRYVNAFIGFVGPETNMNTDI